MAPGKTQGIPLQEEEQRREVDVQKSSEKK